jgi:hypothetical protein
MSEQIVDLQNEFDRAELAGDREVLQRLIADHFVSIGPKGFTLSKAEWIDRHGMFSYQKLDTSDVDVRRYGDHTVIIRNVQHNQATYRDESVDVTVRVSQVWVDLDGRWQLAGIQFSPLAQP